MAKKGKKKRLLNGSDIALAILAALGGAVAFMTIVAVAGSIMFPDSGKRVTADQPPAQTVRGTLPSKTPEATPTPSPVEPSEKPSNEPEPESSSEPVQQTTTPTPTQAPVQTQAPASAQTQAPTPTRAPAVTPSRAPATQNPAPAISVQPVQPTRAPAQSGNQGGSGSGSYAQNFAAGMVLATTASNNNNDPVYHTSYCRSAQRIAASDMYWYNSEQAAINAGRRLCGNCAR